MRMAFGLIGILVALGILVLVMKTYLNSSVAPNSPTVMKARDEAAQIAGYGKDGGRASDSITLDPEVVNGKVDNLIVTSIVPGGAMESYYGLKKDDCIIGTSVMELRGMTDPALAKDMVLDAYQKKYELTVLREGQKIKLPKAGAPAAKSNSKSGNDPIKSQLDAIQHGP